MRKLALAILGCGVGLALLWMVPMELATTHGPPMTQVAALTNSVANTAIEKPVTAIQLDAKPAAVTENCLYLIANVEIPAALPPARAVIEGRTSRTHSMNNDLYMRGSPGHVGTVLNPRALRV